MRSFAPRILPVKSDVVKSAAPARRKSRRSAGRAWIGSLLIVISIKYHLPRLWGAELPDRGLRAAAPAVFEVSSLPYVVDQLGAEARQAFAAGVADAPVDNAISAIREQFLGEGLRFLITVRIKQGAEFGAILAGRIMDAEAIDFLWEARIKERYLGQHFDVCFPPEDEDVELSRIAVMGAFGGSWHAGICLVDGEGSPVDLLWKQSFEDREAAEAAFARAV